MDSIGLGDLLAVMNQKDNDGYGWGGSWFWVIILFFFFAFFGRGFGGYGDSGALSSITIDTAGSLKNVSFSTIVRVLNSCACIDNTANLTVVNTRLEATYSDAEITIVRLN